MTPRKRDEHDRGQTQERLLEAALDIFGRHGFDGATTRMIAKEAEANIATIPYYFGGKEGLYLAVIDRIIELVGEKLFKVREEVEQLMADGPLSPEQASILVERIATAMLMFMVGSPQAHRVARIIIREQLDPTSAYDRIFTGFMAQTLAITATLIRTISPDETERTARIRAMTILGQILVFRVARETVVRGLGMEGYSSEETDEIQLIVQEHLRAILGSLAPPPSS